MGEDEPALSPEDLVIDYTTTIECLQRCLGARAKHAVELDTGERIYAAMLPAFVEYGALEGDERLLFTVTEGPIYDEDQQTKLSTIYTVVLYHLAADESFVHDPDEEEYSIGSTLEDIQEDYDFATAEVWRVMLEAASDPEKHGFDYFEALYNISDQHDSDLVLQARLAEIDNMSLVKRAIKRMRDQKRRMSKDQPKEE